MDDKELRDTFNQFLNENNEINLEFHSTERNKYCYAHYPDSILVQVEKGGSRGGNCWNDNPSECYDREVDEIEEDIVNGLKYRIENLLENLHINTQSKEYKRNVFPDVNKTNEIGEKFYGEYYGNYRIEAIYGVKIKDILKEFLNEDEIEILEHSIENFIAEKKPELSGEIKRIRKN